VRNLRPVLTRISASSVPRSLHFDNKAIYASSNIDRDNRHRGDRSRDREGDAACYENPEVESIPGFSKNERCLPSPRSTPGNFSVIFSTLKRNPSTKRSLTNCQDNEIDVAAHDKAEEKFIVVANNDRTLVRVICL